MRKGRQGTPIEGDDPINLQQALSTATFPSCYYCYLCVQRQTRTHKNTCLLIVCPKGGKAQEHIPSPTPYFSPRRATFFILPFQDTVYEGQARSNIERPTDQQMWWDIGHAHQVRSSQATYGTRVPRRVSGRLGVTAARAPWTQRKEIPFSKHQLSQHPLPPSPATADAKGQPGT